MTYAYDPELVPMLELLPDANLDISDPVASRAEFSGMIAALNAELDQSGRGGMRNGSRGRTRRQMMNKTIRM